MTKYLVTGATGNLGGLTVEALLKSVPAKDVSILARNPAKAEEKFKGKGIKIVRGDNFEYDSLVSAFKGIDKLLIMGAVSLSNRAPQHENLIKAVKETKPGHVIYIGFYRPEGSDIKLREVTEVEIKSEKDLKSSGVPYTIVHNPLYANAFKQLLGGNPKDDGVRVFGPEGRTTYANIGDLGEANANLMTQNGHEDKTYLLNANETVTFRDMAKMWSELYWKDVPFIHGTKQEFIDTLVAKGLPVERAEYPAQFINAVAEGFFEATSDTLTKILGRKPTSLYETFKSDL